jgi:prenyltransferase beta subunit
MQETFKKSQEIWYQKWNSYRFEVILTICFLIWTPILITETLQIQNSCSPMLVFSNEHLERCQEVIIPKVECPNSSGECPTPPKHVSHAIATSIAVAVGAVVAISGAPVIIAAGISLAVWLFVKTLF